MVTGISASQTLIDLFFNPVALQGKSGLYDRLILAAKHNPPILMPNFDKAIQQVLFDQSHDYILIASSTALFPILAQYCNIAYISIQDVVPSMWQTAFVSPSFRRKIQHDLTEAERTLIRVEYNRLMNKYYHKKICSDGVTQVTTQKSLSLSRVQSLFFLYCCALAASLALALIEFLIGYKKRTEILLPNSKDMENTRDEIKYLIELLENESTARGIFLLAEARRMFISGRKPKSNSGIIARNEACSAEILEPEVPWLTLGLGRDLS